MLRHGTDITRHGCSARRTRLASRPHPTAHGDHTHHTPTRQTHHASQSHRPDTAAARSHPCINYCSISARQGCPQCVHPCVCGSCHDRHHDPQPSSQLRARTPPPRWDQRRSDPGRAWPDPSQVLRPPGPCRTFHRRDGCGCDHCAAGAGATACTPDYWVISRTRTISSGVRMPDSFCMPSVSRIRSDGDLYALVIARVECPTTS